MKSEDIYDQSVMVKDSTICDVDEFTQNNDEVSSKTSIATMQRQTKYCRSIELALKQLGHATNAELLAILRERYPDVSATTVHRATTRLAERGAIGTAPPSVNGCMRYDANTSPHDHFLCNQCGQLRDTDIKDEVKPILEKAVKGCSVSGRLTISGTCMNCSKLK